MENIAKLQVILNPEQEEIIIKQSSLEAIEAVKEILEGIGLIQKPYVNGKELKAILRVGEATLDDLRINGLQGKKVGRQTLYKLDDVYRIIDTM